MADETTVDDLKRILDESNIKYTERNSVLEFALTGHQQVYQFACYLRPDHESLSIILLGIRFDSKGATSSFLMDVNFRTWLGHFERDQGDGEIRFRLELPLWRAKLQGWEFLRAVVACGNAVDETIDLIDQVLTEKIDAQAAADIMHRRASTTSKADK